MKRPISYLSMFLPTLAVLSHIQVLSAADTRRGVRHTIIAESGASTPAGGQYSPFSFLNARSNAQHAVAFDAFVIGPLLTSGVFVGDGTTTSTIALGVSPDPATPSFGSVLNPFITRNGAVVFTTGAGEVFRSDGRAIVPLVRIGDPAQGGRVVMLLGNHVVNDGGAVAYFAGVSGATATQAIFRTDGTRTTTIARDDIAPPTGGRFTSLENLDMNNSGRVAFNSEMTGGSADHGIFLGDGGHLTPVFVTHQAAPGGGTVEDCGAPEINARGQVMAICLLTNSASPTGVFVGDGTGAVAIALIGTPGSEWRQL